MSPLDMVRISDLHFSYLYVVMMFLLIRKLTLRLCFKIVPYVFSCLCVNFDAMNECLEDGDWFLVL